MQVAYSVDYVTGSLRQTTNTIWWQCVDSMVKPVNSVCYGFSNINYGAACIPSALRPPLYSLNFEAP